MTYEQFKQAVTAAGLEPRPCTQKHWQIRGGNYTVNFYPETKKGSRFYVNGMAQGLGGGLDEAIRVAKQGIRAQKGAERKRTRGTKKRLLEKDPHCHYCGTEVNWDTARVDHRIALSAGGSNGADNLVLACVKCDTKKKTMLPHKFAAKAAASQAE